MRNTQRVWIALLPLLLAGCLETSDAGPADQPTPADNAATQGRAGSDGGRVPEQGTITRNRHVKINGVECNDGTEERTLLEWNMPQEPPETSGTTTYDFPPRVTGGNVAIEHGPVAGDVQITITDPADKEFFTFEKRGADVEGVTVNVANQRIGGDFAGADPGTHTLSYAAVGVVLGLTITITATVCL